MSDEQDEQDLQARKAAFHLETLRGIPDRFIDLPHGGKVDTSELMAVLPVGHSVELISRSGARIIVGVVPGGYTVAADATALRDKFIAMAEASMVHHARTS